MIRVDESGISTSGTGFEMLRDSAMITKTVIHRVAHGDGKEAECLLYATIMTVIQLLKDNGYEINTEFIGEVIADKPNNN